MKRLLFKSSGRQTAAPILALLLIANLCRGQAATDPWQALPQYQFGQSREPLATIEEQIRKASPTDRAAFEDRLLSILSSPSTTKDCRQFICRWLGTIGSEKSVPPLAALLTDADLSHPARIGLERLPYASAGKALTEALPKANGRLLIGIISSVGEKRVVDAVPQLAALLRQSDTAVVGAALAALGQIGTEAASQVLASATVNPALERDLARARISAASRLAESGKRTEAALVFKQLFDNSRQPPAIRVAAFQGLAATLPEGEAATLMVNVLESDDSLMRSAAVKAFANAPQARDGVAARLGAMQPRGQLLLLGILADMPDVAARKPLLEVTETATDPAVKAAAVECLATHGRADDVALVAKWAATGEAPVRAAARKTLQRISGPGVDSALIRLVESSDSGLRKAAMEALPSRRMQSALLTLTRLVRGSDTITATEAARTLGRMDGTAQLKDLAQVAASTRNDDLRSAAQEAIQAICTRAEDKAACDAVIQGELQQAPTPEARIALLPLTLYTGSDAGLAQVLKALNGDNAALGVVAFKTLVSWPEAHAAAPLLRFAQTNKESASTIIALRDGCLRLAAMEEVPASERASILRQVTQIAQRPEEKRRAISLMTQVPSLELLEFVVRLAEDAGLRAEATASAIQLARSLGAVYPRQSLASLEKVLNLADTPDLRKTVEDGIKAVRNVGQSPEGYILGWMVSGPYTAADKDGSGLFDVAFPPEQNGANVEWRPLGAAPNGVVDLGKPMPGDNRVAYLRVTVTSDQGQPATLELGSDDGLKVWLNGTIVHANNTVRPCSPGQDKVNVRLNKGDNLLLLKVTQGGGEWAAVARICGPDGKSLPSATIGGAGETR